MTRSRLRHHTLYRRLCAISVAQELHHWVGYSESSQGLRGGLLGGFPTSELQPIIRVKWLPSANETRKVLEASIKNKFRDVSGLIYVNSFDFTTGFGRI